MWFAAHLDIIRGAVMVGFAFTRADTGPASSKWSNKHDGLEEHTANHYERQRT